jgi:hypothetical protein
MQKIESETMQHFISFNIIDTLVHCIGESDVSVVRQSIYKSKGEKLREQYRAHRDMIHQRVTVTILKYM